MTVSDRHDSLWWLVAPPSIWAAHFITCYITVSIWCAKFAGAEGHLDPARTLAFGYTAMALLAIAALAARFYRRNRQWYQTTEHDFDLRESRQRFLAFAGLLLAGLSAVAVGYVALAFTYSTSCR